MVQVAHRLLYCGQKTFTSAFSKRLACDLFHADVARRSINSPTLYLLRRRSSTTSSHSSTTISSIGLTYDDYGDLGKVLHASQRTISPSEFLNDNPDGAIIEMLAAPINPADINQIQGTYPIKPPVLPAAVGGNEGLGRIVHIGKNVSENNFEPNDRVLVANPGQYGTWQQFVCVKDAEHDLVSLRAACNNNLPALKVHDAATLYVNPCTAYLLINFMQAPSEGGNNVIVQNGANSAVGLAVIQLARELSMRTVNIIRSERKDFEQLREKLYQLGATHVIGDKDLSKRDVTEKLPKASLALNCVGGKAASDLTRLMIPNGGLHVTYGGMSKMPVMASTSSLIFQNVKYIGFWLSHWKQANKRPEQRDSMLSKLCELIRSGKLVGPEIQPFLLDDDDSDSEVGWRRAIEHSQREKTSIKALLCMNREIYEQVQRECRQPSSSSSSSSSEN